MYNMRWKYTRWNPNGVDTLHPKHLSVNIVKKPRNNNLLADESCCQKISIIRSAFVYPMIILVHSYVSCL